MTALALRRVATYERVSSEDQRERETIKTQTEELARRLAQDPAVTLVQRYVDDGVSGTIFMRDRPAGRQLLADARAGRFDELWVFKLDRLGRDDVDPLLVRQELERLGIRLLSLYDGTPDSLTFAVRVALAAEERRSFLARSAAGMARAARDGRYCGGIVPLGYAVAGKKPHVYLLPSAAPMWGDLSESAVVQRIYRHLAEDGWSCRRIADELNALGVPTAYQKDGRGVRGHQTQGVWRPGRIRNLVVNPVYKGELHYGRRSTTAAGREVIVAGVPALVSPEMWQAAQETLVGYRIMPRDRRRTYLLRGLLSCGVCGLHYCGSMNRASIWYRCDGQLVERGPVAGRCPGKSIKGEPLEAAVWADIERFLRDPGALLEELAEEASDASRRVVAEAESLTLQAARADLLAQRERATQLFIRGHLSDTALDEELQRIDGDQEEIARRLQALGPALTDDQADAPPPQLLEQLHLRLDVGLTEDERGEITRLLVRRITVHTEEHLGKKEARIVVEYRFPGVGLTFTGRGSSLRPARS